MIHIYSNAINHPQSRITHSPLPKLVVGAFFQSWSKLAAVLDSMLKGAPGEGSKSDTVGAHISFGYEYRFSLGQKALKP